MATPNQQIIKPIGIKLAFSVLLLLLSGSLAFYELRMLFVDPAWVTFNIINTGTFAIAEHRYAAVFTQIFPLLGSKLGLSLSTILILYSASFYLLFCSIAWICWQKYGQGQWVVLLAMYFTLGVSDCYFWPNNEVHQGICWMALYMAFTKFHVERNSMNGGRHLIAVVIGFLALFSHLLVALPFAYFFLYQFGGHYKRQNNRSAVYLQMVELSAIMLSRLYLSTQGWYDSQKLVGVSNLSIEKILGVFKSGGFQSITTLFTNNYISLSILSLIGIIYLLYKRAFYFAASTLFFGWMTLSLILITYPDAFDRSLRFYMESEWMPLTLILAAPFVYQILPKLNTRWTFILLVLVFASRLPYFVDAHHFFKERYDNLELLVQREGPPNQLLPMTYTASTQFFIMPWGLPVETIMLSKMKGQKPQRTVKIVEPGFLDTIDTKRFYYTGFKADEKSGLNAQYFELSDGGYEDVGMEDLE